MPDESFGEGVFDDDEIIACWCGAEGTFEELFDIACLDESCGGTGELHCYCGGDFCVCHHHGSTECPGCEDCRLDEDWSEGWPDDYEFDDGIA